MKAKHLIITIVLLVCTFNPILSQSRHIYYVHIQNKEYVPAIIKTKDKNALRASSTITSFDRVLEKYRFYEFTQAFPTAHTDWLREVYYVVCDNDNFARDMNEFHKSVPLIEQLCEPVVIGDTPNDPIYTTGDMTDLDLINANDAWFIAKRYPKINAAITDTYFDTTHEDLSFTLVGGSNNENVSSVAHGTFTAGRLGAINNNGKGVASSGGYNTNLYISTIWASDGEVLRLAQLGYRVINCSWLNGCSFSITQNALYDEIRNIHNAVVIFGAANGYVHCNGNKTYPASYESCVSVTSIGHKHTRGVLDTDGIARNWKDVHEFIIGDPNNVPHQTHHHNDAVDICAPGYQIYSTAYKNTYYESTGTSFAAPQVAGVAAMILAVNPSLTANQVVNILKNTADTSIYNIPENASYIGLLGAGRLDAYAAVQAACAIPIDFTNQTVTTNTTVTSCGDINVQNVKVQNGAKLILDAAGEVNIISDFEVEVGSEFEIK